MRNAARSILAAAAGLLAPACGPYLETVTQSRTAWEASARCTQGPLEFSAVAVGARWGEGVILAACSPRDIQGRFRATLDGDEIGNAEWGSRKRVLRHVPGTADSPDAEQPVWVPVERPDNAWCVGSAEEIAEGRGVVGVDGSAPGGDGGSGGATAEPEAGSGGAATGSELAAAAPVEMRRTAQDAGPDPQFPEDPCSGSGLAFFEIGNWAWRNQDPQAAALTAGAEVHVQVWFVEPNDLEGVTFWLSQFVDRPSCSDEEWIAHLEEERAERLEEEREWQEEWARGEAERERERQERSAWCDAHHEDEDCWGPGGYDGAVARMIAEQEEADRRALEPPPTPPPPAPPPPPEPQEPAGPPPAPMAEERPPRSSENAEWITGYWRWSGFEWGWIAGWWRVPEADVEAGLTVHAPEAPPPPRTEVRPSPPAPDAVWTAGFWQWDGAAWVWVKGSWQIPPRADAEWRPAEWRIEAGGALFLPGGWSVRIGP